jgi:hypothetical protein
MPKLSVLEHNPNTCPCPRCEPIWPAPKAMTDDEAASFSRALREMVWEARTFQEKLVYKTLTGKEWQS